MYPVQNMMFKLVEPGPDYLMNQDYNTKLADYNALEEFKAKVENRLMSETVIFYVLFYFPFFYLKCLNLSFNIFVGEGSELHGLI